MVDCPFLFIDHVATVNVFVVLWQLVDHDLESFLTNCQKRHAHGRRALIYNGIITVR